jgi:short-subunit dehydrogenase
MPGALITGASSGIGEQFAYFLARDGYTLALSARREDRLRAVAAEASRRGATGVSIFPADLGRRSAPGELYSQVTAAGLKIEMLVNNAGFGTRGRFDHLPLERELEEIDLNVSALVALTHLFLPAMIAARKGTVINVASTASFQPVPHMSTYAATKAFVLSFSQGLHYELIGSGVNVMALCPGATRTEFQAVANNETPWVPASAYMDAETVVAQGLRAVRRKRAICVNGIMNSIAAEAVRAAPRWLVARIAGMMYRPTE